MIDHLDHIVLTTARTEECIDFYTRVLGMKFERFGEGRMALKFGGQKINLHEKEESSSPRRRSPPGDARHLLHRVGAAEGRDRSPCRVQRAYHRGAGDENRSAGTDPLGIRTRSGRQTWWRFQSGPFEYALRHMRIAFVADPLSSFKIYKDSTLRHDGRGREARSRAVFRAAGRPHVEGRSGYRRNFPPHSHRRQGPLVSDRAAQETPLAEFGAVLMRKDPPFDTEYVASTWLLELAQKDGAKVFNDPRAIRDHSEKLAIAKYPQFSRRRW